MHAGWFTLTEGDFAGVNQDVTFGTYLEWEYQWFALSHVPTSARYVRWAIPQGNTVVLKVQY
jgi:hypothetical protein